MASIAPSERLRRELEDLIGRAGEVADPIEAIGPARAPLNHATFAMTERRRSRTYPAVGYTTSPA